MRFKLLYHWRKFWAGLQKAKPVQKSAPLCIAAVFKNEAPFLKEWIDFHLAQGVQRFYLADNYSEDDPENVLAPYQERGQLFLSKTASTEMDARIQAQELNTLLKLIEAKEGAHVWLAVVDIDEFLFNPKATSIPETLKPFEEQNLAAVVVNWLMFGHSNLPYLDPNKSMLQQLSWRAHVSLGEHKMVKPILYLANQAGFIEGPHTPIVKGKARLIHANGVDYQAANPQIIHAPLRINHYWYRSIDYYESEKRAKRRAFGDERSGKREADHIKACNYEEDKAILKVMP